jgi:hypothetical protein
MSNDKQQQPPAQEGQQQRQLSVRLERETGVTNAFVLTPWSLPQPLLAPPAAASSSSSSARRCTFGETGRLFFDQPYHNCVTCDPGRRMGICIPCLEAGCHEGHTIMPKVVGPFFCDCGAGDTKVKCRCSAAEDSKEKNWKTCAVCPVIPQAIWSSVQAFLDTRSFVCSLATSRLLEKAGGTRLACPEPQFLAAVCGGNELPDLSTDSAICDGYLVDAPPPMEQVLGLRRLRPSFPSHCTKEEKQQYEQVMRHVHEQEQADYRAYSRTKDAAFPHAHERVPIRVLMSLWSHCSRALRIGPHPRRPMPQIPPGSSGWISCSNGDFPVPPQTLSGQRVELASKEMDRWQEQWFAQQREITERVRANHPARVDAGLDAPSLPYLGEVAARCAWVANSRILLVSHTTTAKGQNYDAETKLRRAESDAYYELRSRSESPQVRQAFGEPLEILDVHLVGLHALRFLSLSHVALTVAAMRAIGSLPSLTALRLGWLFYRSQSSRHIQPAPPQGKGILLDEGLGVLAAALAQRAGSLCPSQLQHLDVETGWPAKHERAPLPEDEPTLLPGIVTAACEVAKQGLRTLRLGELDTRPYSMPNDVKRTLLFASLLRDGGPTPSRDLIQPAPAPILSLRSLTLGPASFARSDLLEVLLSSGLPLQHLDLASDLTYTPRAQPNGRWVHTDIEEYNGANRMRTRGGLWMQLCKLWASSMKHLRITGLQPYQDDEDEFVVGIALLKQLESLYFANLFTLSGISVVSRMLLFLPQLRILSLGKDGYQNLEVDEEFVESALKCPSLTRIIFYRVNHSYDSGGLFGEGVTPPILIGANDEKLLRELSAKYNEKKGGQQVLRIRFHSESYYHSLMGTKGGGSHQDF